MEGDKLEWALRWARKGFRVFPLKPGTKQPMIKEFYEHATTSEEVIRGWWSRRPDANIGVSTDNLIVVDIDTKKGKNGQVSWVELGLSFDEMDTLVTQTPSGGEHAYYVGPNRSLSAGRLGSGLDIRSYHGYVVGPGSYIDQSVDPSAGCSGYYSVLADRPVRDVPSEVLRRLDVPISDRSTTPAVALDGPGAVARAIHFLSVEAAPAVEGEGGDFQTLKVAMTVKDFGVSQDMCADLLAEHYNPRCAPPWSPEELLTKVHNAYAYGSRAPGSDSPEAAFQGVSVPPINSHAGPWFHHGDSWNKNEQWLYYQVLPAQGLVLVTGPSQSGKSFLLTAAAWSLATGQPFFDVEPDNLGGTIFLFAGSEGSGFPARLEALQEKALLPIAARPVAALGINGALGRLYEDLKAKMAEMMDRYGQPVRMIVLETLATCGLIRDENDNMEVSQAMVSLSELARSLNVLLLVSHHPPKHGDGARGAGSLKDAADGHLEVQRQGKETVRTVFVEKARNAPQRSLGSFTLLPVDLGQDERGRPITSMVISSGTAKAAVGPKESHSALLLECIEWVCIEDGIDIDGVRCAPIDDVKELFRERKPGSKDRSNVGKAWRASFDFAVTMGSIEEVILDKGRYLKRKEIG